MPMPGGSRRGNGPIGPDGDPIGDALRQAGDTIATAPLDRTFYDWYWPLMAPPAAN